MTDRPRPAVVRPSHELEEHKTLDRLRFTYSYRCVPSASRTPPTTWLAPIVLRERIARALREAAKRYCRKQS